MTKTRSTKRALAFSFISLLLCISMFVGSTFAWFTDSVSTVNNKIVAGNLDVELYYSANMTDWAKVEADTNIFTDSLWEPGYTEVVYLKVVNEGTLALKYIMNVAVASETGSVNVNGDAFKLSDFIEYGITPVQSAYATRAAAVNAVVMNSMALNEAYASADSETLLPGKEAVVAMVVYMPSSVDNAANHAKGAVVPTINLGINLLATQLEHENDSFGNDYDADADFAISAGENKVLTSPIINETLANNGTVTVNGGAINSPDRGFENYGEATLNDVEINAGNAAEYSNVTSGVGAKTEYNDVDIVSGGGGVGAANGGEVVFNSGSVDVNSTSTSGRYLFYAEGAGTVITINGGNFDFNKTQNQKRAYIYAGTGSTVYVKGGTFGKASTRSGYTAGILGDGDVIITGGTFGFDPTNWVATGYKATKVGENWVVTLASIDPVESDLSLIEALENGKDVVLMDDVAIDKANLTSNGYGATGINLKVGQTIDGQGNILDINGAGGTWDSGISAAGGVIKNITVTGAFRGVFVKNNTEKVVLENVIIDGTTYTISCDQGSGAGLEATNCTFNGWTSYAATIGNVKFTDCSFGEGNGYAYCRPYAPTEFVGCDFEAGFHMDARAVVTFKNCTIGGVALTNENLSTLVNSNTANASVVD